MKKPHVHSNEPTAKPDGCAADSRQALPSARRTLNVETSEAARFARLFLLCLTLTAAGCSTFDRDWKLFAGITPAPGSVEGRWEGRWKSDHNGHNGKLRCVMLRTGTNTYTAKFHAKYQGILSFGYTVPLEMREESGRFQFTGHADLGALAGGLYTYEGHATTTNFFSTYRCPSDWGTFRLERPKR
ncbi:MAG: hypothetical protein FJ386_12980 [Verrucomicrobia bacterium]|nr:hypothetical protein [Verrucomicrobiota bacterium]